METLNNLEPYQERLVEETKELAVKVNKLQDFMRTLKFYQLPRAKKDLMYEQLSYMTSYLQVLGKRLEIEQINLETVNFF